jgi:hypothetical protein
MAKNVEDGRKVLPSELAHALGGYKATAQLWRNANGLVRKHRLLERERPNSSTWPIVLGRVEAEAGRAITRMHVFMDDTPPIFTGEYAHRLDCLGVFGVQMSVVREDGKGYRMRAFGGKWAASNSLCRDNAILQDPDKMYDSAQRAITYPVWTDAQAERLQKAAERQTAQGRDMFAQLTEGLQTVDHSILTPLADEFAHLLETAEA